MILHITLTAYPGPCVPCNIMLQLYKNIYFLIGHLKICNGKQCFKLNTDYTLYIFQKNHNKV
jgi:hypothetical protein